ncbi:MAG: TetR/AcrR family transcriptional regulator [Chitinophagaceae bacterium]|nr:MAG: TetR/AcrR family transcriptional regulator [Chitinophagaceae bacterium]
MARTKDFDENAVLNKAVCLFWHKGYNGTSMQELVDGLGISRSSMYDTFGDKHELYIKALAHYQQEGSKQLCAIVSSAVSGKEAIRKLLEHVTSDMLGDKQRKGCFMVNANVETASHDPEVMKIVTRNEEMVEDAFLKAIKKGLENGEFKTKQDARALARFVSNSIKGIQVSSKSIKDKKVFADIVEATLSVFD